MNKLFLLISLSICFSLPVSGKPAHTPSNYFQITISASSIRQGQTLTVFVNSANRLKRLELTFLDQKLSMDHVWHKDHAHLFRTFIGIPANTKPGSYKIVARGTDINRQKLSIYTLVRVKDAGFKIQQIRLSKKKTKLLDQKILQEEGAILKSQFLKKDRRVYFKSPFGSPVAGRVSSSFGLRRKYNGDAISTYHKGLDIANKTGTPIYATNGGQVTLAVHWKSHGKTILINHGHGIITIYIHMDKLLVKTGDWVKKGQIIGRLGSTGIANGPHLHFGVSVNNVRVNPAQWIKNRVRLFF